MLLADVQAVSVAVAKDAKAEAVRLTGARRGSDIRPELVCYRGEDPVAMVLLRDHVRDEILHMFQLCAAGFAADSIATIFETFAAPSLLPGRALNPRTGQPWTDGGMQYEVEHHQALERGWVVEAVTVTTVNRAGDAAMTTLPYHYDRSGLVWDEAEPLGAPTGRMIRTMVKAMNTPPAELVVRELAARSTIDERDTWTADLLMANAECVVALVALSDDPDRIATIDRGGPVL